MGKISELIHRHIVNGAKIGCVTPVQHLIVCSVSNWGGYALAAAMSAAAISQRRGAISSVHGHWSRDVDSVIDAMMVTTRERERFLHNGVRSFIRFLTY